MGKKSRRAGNVSTAINTPAPVGLPPAFPSAPIDFIVPSGRRTALPRSTGRSRFSRGKNNHTSNAAKKAPPPIITVW